MDTEKNDDLLHPIYRFLKNPEIDMLHAALPFLSNRSRIPLALYIKTKEVQRILSDFGREDLLTACGFEKNTPDPEAMLKAMKLAGGENTSPQIDHLLNMMNLLKTYRNLHDMIQNNPEMVTFLNTMMSQANNPVSTKSPSAPPSNSPQDLLKQFGITDTKDVMSLLSQMMSRP